MTTTTTAPPTPTTTATRPGLFAAPLRLAVCAAIGGLVISLGDHLFHVRTDVLVHHWYPQVDRQMVSVIPAFIAAAAVMLLGGRIILRWRPASSSVPPSILVVIGDAAWFYAAYALTGVIGVDHKPTVLLLLSAAFAFRMAFATDRRALLALGVAIGLGGCLGEAGISAVGAFDYRSPDVLGVPFWLFPLYLNGAPAMLDLARWSLPGPARPAA